MSEKAYITHGHVPAPALPREDVEVPEWGEGAVVCLQGLSGSKKDRFTQDVLVRGADGKYEPDILGLRAKLIARSAIDPKTGEPVFTEAEVEALNEHSSRIVERLYAVSARLSGIGEDELKAAQGRLTQAQG